MPVVLAIIARVVTLVMTVAILAIIACVDALGMSEHVDCINTHFTKYII